MSTKRSTPETRRRRWYAAGAVALAAAAIAAVTSTGIGQNLVYYWSPTELLEAGERAVGATIRMGGQVAPGSIVESDGGALEFEVTDGHTQVRVRTHGIPPQMFREGIGVVVEGTVVDLGEGVFESSRLMVSHDNEYKVPEEGSEVDVEKIMRTTDGMEARDGGPRGSP